MLEECLQAGRVIAHRPVIHLEDVAELHPRRTAEIEQHDVGMKKPVIEMRALLLVLLLGDNRPELPFVALQIGGRLGEEVRDGGLLAAE
jgi:hypothetical protein